jgi:hypothetical protein
LNGEVERLRKQSIDNGFSAYYRPGIRDEAGKILGSTAIWLDLDVVEHNISIPETQAALSSFSPRPSVVVWSGRGFHVYWLLSSFCGDIERLKRITKGLAEAFPRSIQKCIDKQVVNDGPNGSLRIVGSRNWKNGFAMEVVVQKAENVRYDLNDFPEKIERSTKVSVTGGQISGRSVKDIFLHYFSELDIAKEQHCVNCPFHEDTNPSLSINLETGMWKCRSASHPGQSQGGIVSFYALMERKPIKEAKSDLKYLCQSSDKDSITDQVKELILAKFLPLYREEDDSIIGMNKESHELVSISFANQSFITGMAKALGGSPKHIIEDQIPADVLQMVLLESLLRDIMLDILVELPREKSFHIIGSGIHHIETKQGWKTFLVNGEKMFEHDGRGWIESTLAGPAYGEIIPRFGLNEWYRFWRAEWGTIPTPKQLWDELFPLLKNNWVWTEESDPYLIGLFTMYVWYHQWFGRPLEGFVCGPSESGKSSLTEGWLAGTRDGSIGLFPSCISAKSSSLAGFYQTASYQSKLLVLDEIYDSDEPAAKQLMEALRNMDAKDFAVIRGTPSGKSKRYPIRMPVFWSAIQGPKLIQDQNRKILIHLHPQENLRDPWDKIMLQKTPDDFHRLEAALPLYLLPFRKEIDLAREEILNKFLRPGKISWRRGNMLMPLLQIASVIGLDIDKLIMLLTSKVQGEQKEAKAEAVDRELLSFILDHKFVPGNIENGLTTSLADRIVQRVDLSEPNLGIYFRAKDNKIYFQPPQLINNLLSKFPMFRSITTRRLGSILRPHPYFEETRTIYLGTQYGIRRCVVLDAAKVLSALEIVLDREQAEEIPEMASLN